MYFLILSPNLPILWAHTKLVGFFFAKAFPQSHMKTALCSAQGWTYFSFYLIFLIPTPYSEHNSVYPHPSENVCWWLNAVCKEGRRTKASWKKEGQTQSLDDGRKIINSKYQHLELYGWVFWILWSHLVAIPSKEKMRSSCSWDDVINLSWSGVRDKRSQIDPVWNNAKDKACKSEHVQSICKLEPIL